MWKYAKSYGAGPGCWEIETIFGNWGIAFIFGIGSVASGALFIKRWGQKYELYQTTDQKADRAKRF